MENGELVYLTTAGDLLGRGIGRWVNEGSLIAFQMDIFQYEAMTSHRFPRISFGGDLEEARPVLALISKLSLQTEE